MLEQPVAVAEHLGHDAGPPPHLESEGMAVLAVGGDDGIVCGPSWGIDSGRHGLFAHIEVEEAAYLLRWP